MDVTTQEPTRAGETPEPADADPCADTDDDERIDAAIRRLGRLADVDVDAVLRRLAASRAPTLSRAAEALAAPGTFDAFTAAGEAGDPCTAIELPRRAAATAAALAYIDRRSVHRPRSPKRVDVPLDTSLSGGMCALIVAAVAADGVVHLYPVDSDRRVELYVFAVGREWLTRWRPADGWVFDSAVDRQGAATTLDQILAVLGAEAVPPEGPER